MKTGNVDCLHIGNNSKLKMLKLINDYYVLHLLCYDLFKEDVCHLKLTDKTKIVISESCIMQLGSKLQTK